MIKFENRCKDCDRKVICKYCGDMDKLVKALNEAVLKLGVVQPFHDALFSIPMIDCDYFRFEKPTPKGR